MSPSCASFAVWMRTRNCCCWSACWSLLPLSLLLRFHFLSGYFSRRYCGLFHCRTAARDGGHHWKSLCCRKCRCRFCEPLPSLVEGWLTRPQEPSVTTLRIMGDTGGRMIMRLQETSVTTPRTLGGRATIMGGVGGRMIMRLLS